MKKILFLSLMGAMLFTSCKKDEVKKDKVEEKSDYTLLQKDTTANDLVVELFIKSTAIEVGYQNFYVKIKNLSGKVVENATVLFEPDMDMGQMKHGSPVVQPTFSTTSKLYEGIVIFTMPSGNMGSWILGINVNGEKISFPVTVKPSKEGTKYVGSYTGTDQGKYFVTLVKPFAWKVGMNDVKIIVHKRINMYEYEPVENLTVKMDPQMTSMEHGSPNNIDPVSKGKGYYEGKANFTMTGDWRLFFDIYAGEDLLLEEAYIDILF